MRDAGALAWLLTAGIVPNLAFLTLGAWMLRVLPLSARGAERLGKLNSEIEGPADAERTSACLV